jgi:hypothetical protein
MTRREHINGIGPRQRKAADKEWKVLADGKGVRCLNCGHVIPNEYDPYFCIFGRHAKKPVI